MSKVVAIHQPNFLPWLGWFDKLARADVLVLLDNVAMRRSGSSWVNRVQVLIRGRAEWLTVPVEAGTANRARIGATRIAEDGKWRARITRTIEHAYGRTCGYDDVMPELTSLFEKSTSNLCEFNLTGVRILARLLGLEDRPMVRASELTLDEGSGTDLLVNCVRAVEGTAYLAGGGASGYQDDEKLANAGIEVVYQGFQHPVYAQRGTEEFVPGLSAIDALMNCGVAGAARLLGKKPAFTQGS